MTNGGSTPREPLTELQALVTGAVIGALMKAVEHGLAIEATPITDELGYTEKIKVKGLNSGDEVLVVVMAEYVLPVKLEAVPDDPRTINVYVPRGNIDGTPLHGIDPGSGIVGTTPLLHSEGGDGVAMLRVDYEGNRYGAVNIRTFADRVARAWERAERNYPTVARAALPITDLIRVGEFEPEVGVVHVYDFETLSEWIGVELSKTERNPELWVTA